MTPDEIRSIYAGIESRAGLSLDLQGWNSDEPLFAELIQRVKPQVIVEVGAWKGRSVVNMGRLCRERGLDTIIYAVDVWYGLAHGHYHIGHVPGPIPPSWDGPTAYEQFLFNVRASALDDCVVPVWNHTSWGATMLKAWGVVADLIYVDAGHTEDAAFDDITGYWPLLREGGVMFGDDYASVGVQRAVRRAGLLHGRDFSVVNGHWLMPNEPAEWQKEQER